MKSLLNFTQTVLIISMGFISFGGMAWDQHPLEEDSSVSVWTKPVSGSDFKAFKGQILINANVNRILSVIQDTQNLPEWYYKSKYAEQLQRINPDQSLNYSITSMPWPVSDRDSVILATVTRHTNGHITINMKGQPEDYPAQANLVRVPTLNGSWHLEKVEEYVTIVTLQIATEPGGEIPSWLANAMVVDMPFYSLTNLKKRVEKQPN